MMLIQLAGLIYLAVLAMLDAKYRELPLWILCGGSLFAVAAAFFSIMNHGQSMEKLLFGLVPGMMLLCVAGISKGAGLGDGIVLLQIDMVFFLEKTITAFVASIFAISLFSVILLFFHKGNKETKLPYLPFLWLGCLGAMFI